MNIKFDLNKLQILEEVNNSFFSKYFNNNSKNSNIIFIYTPPKVGSTSLVSSIRISAAHKYSVVHIHDDCMLNCLTGNKNITVNEIIRYNKYIGKNVFVIDIYRSPLERKISDFFEKISTYHFNNTEESINNYNINKVIDRFNNLFPHLYSKDYFQDVYNIHYPDQFDFMKKYLLVEENGIKYIKLRLIDSDKWSNILTSILDTEIVIIKDYETSNKKIGDLYKKFKDSYKIPLNLFQLIKDCKYLKYYYTEEERNSYLSKLCMKTTINNIPYTVDEYNFYMKLSIENKYYNDIQSEHYRDVGCICVACSKKRFELFKKAKKGEVITDKIIHHESVNEFKTNIIQSISKNLKSKNKKININTNTKQPNTAGGKTILGYMKDIVNNNK
jgi:hypothetical protein